MNRYCFTLHVRRDTLEEYRQRHRAVWPEMLEALRDSGWTNYSLFLDDDGLLVGYVECEDLAAAQAAMAATVANRRWQQDMAPFFDGIKGGQADDNLHVLPLVFQLEQQLAALPKRR